MSAVDEDRAALEERRREARRRTARIPPKWEAQTFEALEADAPRLEALAAARRWADGEQVGLLLWGDVGRGKTAIAAAAAGAFLERGRLRWLSVASLLLDLRLGFDAPEYQRAVRALQEPEGRALVLDDLDKLKPTEWAVQPLYVAVNGWIEGELPLLVTMNRDLDALAADFGERFGEPIASRLAEYCQEVEVPGRDRRLQP